MLKNILQKNALQYEEKLDYTMAIRKLKHLCIESSKMGAQGMRVRVCDLSDEYIPANIENSIAEWGTPEGLEIDFEDEWVVVFWDK